MGEERTLSAREKRMASIEGEERAGAKEDGDWGTPPKVKALTTYCYL